MNPSMLGVSGVMPTKPQVTPGNQIFMDGQVLTIKVAPFNVTATGDQALVPAVAGKKIRVLAITLTCSVATAVSFKSAAGTTLIQGMSFAANGGMDVNRMPHGWFCETAVGEALNMNNSVASNVRGSLCYVEV
jgi:hypothetical protein